MFISNQAQLNGLNKLNHYILTGKKAIVRLVGQNCLHLKRVWNLTCAKILCLQVLNPICGIYYLCGLSRRNLQPNALEIVLTNIDMLKFH